MREHHLLLAEYARSGSETAFRELVSRYVDLVYSTAVRLVEGDTHRAEDITQTVFLDLARKAGTLSSEVMLGGWLHRHTCFVAANVMRGERRRQQRERQAVQMSTIEDHSAANLAQVAPILDDAINQLGAEDRAAILLRFFEKRDFRSVGEALGGSENAAQKRVTRALEELRGLLQKRGVTLSAAALGTAMTAEAVTAAPVTLAAGIATAALTGAAGVGTASTFLKIMSMTKIKAGLAAAMVVGSVATSLIIQQNADAKMRAMDGTLGQQSAQIAGLEKTGEWTNAAPTSSTDQMDELQKLRAEVAALRNQTNAIATLRVENQRLRAARVPAQPAAGLQEQVAAQEESMTRMSHGKQLALGVIQAAMDNQGQVPTNFDAAMKHVGGQIAVETLVPDQFEIVYQGSFNQREVDPSRLILIREKQPRKMPDGTWQRVYIFLDGHGVVHSETNRNFDAYEAQGGIKPSPR